jgi:hypothetical protein
VLEQQGLLAPTGQAARHTFYTTGAAAPYQRALERLSWVKGPVRVVRWQGEHAIVERSARP